MIRYLNLKTITRYNSIKNTKYLKINCTKDAWDLYTENYKTLLREILQGLNK